MTAYDKLENDDVVIVYGTYPSAEVAERIGGGLVERGLAACVNILPGMTSIYIWEAKLQRESEVSMLVKTCAGRADAVIAAVRAAHPYSNPALLVLPVSGGAAAFLDWVRAETNTPRMAPPGH